MSVIRPDGIKMDLFSTSLPHSDSRKIHNERIFSTDSMIKKNIALQSEKLGFTFDRLSAEDIIFSKSHINEPLKGKLHFFH